MKDKKIKINKDLLQEINSPGQMEARKVLGDFKKKHEEALKRREQQIKEMKERGQI